MDELAAHHRLSLPISRDDRRSMAGGVARIISIITMVKVVAEAPVTVPGSFGCDCPAPNGAGRTSSDARR